MSLGDILLEMKAIGQIETKIQIQEMLESHSGAAATKLDTYLTMDWIGMNLCQDTEM